MAWNGLSVRFIVCQPVRIDIMRLEEMQAIGKKIHQVYKIGWLSHLRHSAMAIEASSPEGNIRPYSRSLSVS